ncbi:cell adhesion molecule 2-like [Mytilus edulis]|uniref:cell adhesion molecule 2-like n=1 Tax=Mytilus edulis TaxID=6550 RepID=UPI0039F0A21A
MSVQLQATPSEVILGLKSLQLRCSYTTATGEFVTGVNIQAKINGQLKSLALFYTPLVPLNATLTTDGNYLTNRVTLTNPTTTGTDYAAIQFSEIACEDEKEYMCQVPYAGSSGISTANSSVAYINVRANPEKPDSVPSYVPSAGIEEGTTVVFTCTGNVGKPEGKFRWVRYRRNSNGVIIQETSYETETTTAFKIPWTCTFTGTSQLTLKMEQLDNNAVVRCQIVYQDVPQGRLYKQTYPINVYYSVRNVQVTKSSTNPIFSEGAGPITLTCKSDGNPAGTRYTWHKQSEANLLLWIGSTYFINNVVVNETDTYICVAQNSFNGQTFNMNTSIHIQIGE